MRGKRVCPDDAGRPDPLTSRSFLPSHSTENSEEPGFQPQRPENQRVRYPSSPATTSKPPGSSLFCVHRHDGGTCAVLISRNMFGATPARFVFLETRTARKPHDIYFRKQVPCGSRRKLIPGNTNLAGSARFSFPEIRLARELCARHFQE